METQTEKKKRNKEQNKEKNTHTQIRRLSIQKMKSFELWQLVQKLIGNLYNF